MDKKPTYTSISNIHIFHKNMGERIYHKSQWENSGTLCYKMDEKTG